MACKRPSRVGGLLVALLAALLGVCSAQKDCYGALVSAKYSRTSTGALAAALASQVAALLPLAAPGTPVQPLADF